ncbi:MAG TPA: acyl-CoA dehydrogenase family protein [Planctomycetota bacterium]|nr:acyl-CoA dehydrogenase family protein [Planctomycetota bacterium]
MREFKGVDFYGVDGLLSDEERMVRDTVRAFVTERMLGLMPDCWERGAFPKQLIPEIGELGLMGANLQGYGCAGMNNVAYGLALQELERGDSGVRSFCSVQGALVMYPIHAFGSEEQKQKYLPRLAKAEIIGCFGLTEPDFGSNPGGMKTRAVRRGDRWVLNGTKMWITNGSMADVAVVWAKVDDVVHGFLVEKGTKGFAAQEVKGKLSLRISDTSELLLTDCEIPDANRLPGTDGLKSALMCLNAARYGIAWGAVGAAMACYDEALSYAKNRVQFTKPIAGYQLVQAKLVQMVSEITKAQLLCLQLGRLKDAGKSSFVQVSMAKRNNVSEALKIARAARDILGGNGIINEYQSMRHMCNLETVYTYEGTHDIHTLIIGEHITGLPAYF